MSCGRIDHPRAASIRLFNLVDHGDRLARRGVVQAQDHQVDAGHQFALGGCVLAQLGVDADQLDLRHLLEPLPYLQAGGSGFPINEYLGHVRSS